MDKSYSEAHVSDAIVDGTPFAVTLESSIDRFLILGLSVSTKINLSAAANVRYEGLIAEARAILGNPQMVESSVAQLALIDKMVELVSTNRVYKRQPSMAMLAVLLDPRVATEVEVRRKVAEAVPRIVRTLTDIYVFMSILTISGRRSGSNFMKAVSNAIITNGNNNRDIDSFIKGLLKFKSRDDWRFGDILRLSHTNLQRINCIKELTPKERRAVIHLAVTGSVDTPDTADLHAVLKQCSPTYNAYITAFTPGVHTDTLVNLVENEGLDMDLIPNDRVNNARVIKALIHRGMPVVNLLRSLSSFDNHNIWDADTVARVRETLFMGVSRLHPIQVFLASYAYGSRFSTQSSQEIKSMLEELFVMSFSSMKGDAQDDGLKLSHSIDLSASMYWDNSRVGTGIHNPLAGDVAAAMAFINTRLKKPENYTILGFGGVRNPEAINIGDMLANNEVSTLEGALKCLRGILGGSTNTGAAIRKAINDSEYFDGFVVWTDNDLNSGENPAALLREYRQKINPNARLMTISMSSGINTVADPKDRGMMDIVGFDASVPEMITDFMSGNL